MFNTTTNTYRLTDASGSYDWMWEALDALDYADDADIIKAVNSHASNAIDMLIADAEERAERQSYPRYGYTTDEVYEDADAWLEAKREEIRTEIEADKETAIAEFKAWRDENGAITVVLPSTGWKQDAAGETSVTATAAHGDLTMRVAITDYETAAAYMINDAWLVDADGETIDEGADLARRIRLVTGAGVEQPTLIAPALRGRAGLSVAEAAKLRGISEQAVRDRLRGRAGKGAEGAVFTNPETPRRGEWIIPVETVLSWRLKGK